MHFSEGDYYFWFFKHGLCFTNVSQLYEMKIVFHDFFMHNHDWFQSEIQNFLSWKILDPNSFGIRFATMFLQLTPKLRLKKAEMAFCNFE